MSRYCKLFLCFTASVTAAALGQTQPANSGSPVAYVYVSRPTHIDGFAASANGQLTPVPGSPFAGNGQQGMAVSGAYLFGSGSNQTDIYSCSIAPDGALKPVAAINVQKYNSSGCGGLGPPLLDHTAASLYAGVSIGGSGPGYDCAESAFQSYSIDKHDGALQYLGSSGDIFAFYGALSFTGNNRYAYGAGCDEIDAMFVGNLVGFERHNNGFLAFAIDGPSPKPESAADFYCPQASIADPSNHLAVVLQAINLETESFDGTAQLAAYTADEHGNLTTESTYKNMPRTAVTNISDIEISPSGKLLVVGGQGFQIYRFNGASPIEQSTGLLDSNDQFQQFRWDSANHLYALGAGQLFVYIVTSAGVKQAPGSPYAIPEAGSIAVLSK
jgi:hypothetical protein